MGKRTIKKTITLFIVMMMVTANVFVVSGSVKTYTDDTPRTPSGIPLSELEQFVNDFMVEYVGTSVAGAQVIIVKHDEVLVSGSFGYTDIYTRTLVDEDTVFSWGSSSKTFVWVSVMQLAEQGQLDLNADIREYLPDGFFRRLRYDTPITMYNLMHHNAGWEERQTDFYAVNADDLISLSEAMRIFEPLQVFEPGTIVAYSNYGVALAGYIVQRISVVPFHEYVRMNIFEPLGMNDTAVHPYWADNISVAERRSNNKGHVPNDGVLTHTSRNILFAAVGYPTGGAIGTANDMAKFISALVPGEGELSPLFQDIATLQQMLSVSYSYGYGFPGIAHGLWEEFFGVRVVGHDGGLPGFGSRLVLSPETGFGIAVMTNTGATRFVGTGLITALLGEYTPEYIGTLPDIRNLNNLEGSYLTARRVGSGFMNLLVSVGNTATSMQRMSVIDENTLSFMGFEFEQISPYVFRNTSVTGDVRMLDIFQFLYLTVEDGYVTRISTIFSDVTRISEIEIAFVVLSGISFVVCVAYLVVVLFKTLIKGIKNRKSKTPLLLVKKLCVAINSFGLAMVVNYLVMIARVTQHVPSRALTPHFGINIAYMIFAPACGLFIMWKMRNIEVSKSGKVFVFLSLAVAFSLAGLMFTWEFYR